MEEARMAIAETRMVVAETRVDIAETRMVTAETLNVTHKMDDKVAVLIDGGRDTFSGHPPFLIVDMPRCKRGKRRHTTVCEYRR